MPTAISQLETKFNVRVKETVKWGDTVSENAHGIYIISTSDCKDYLPVDKTFIKFDDNQFKLWIKNAPEITLHDKRVGIVELKLHLPKFWLPDEAIIYIGKAEIQSLSKRISQFYAHKVGNKSPHKGGYWLKLLSNYDLTYIHLILTNKSHDLEEYLLQYFIDNVSDDTKKLLEDNILCLPYANLKLRSGVVKNHVLKNHYT